MQDCSWPINGRVSHANSQLTSHKSRRYHVCVDCSWPINRRVSHANSLLTSHKSRRYHVCVDCSWPINGRVSHANSRLTSHKSRRYHVCVDCSWPINGRVSHANSRLTEGRRRSYIQDKKKEKKGKKEGVVGGRGIWDETVVVKRKTGIKSTWNFSAQNWQGVFSHAYKLRVEGIVSDLFPRMIEQQVDYGILEQSIKETCLIFKLEDVSARQLNNPCSSIREQILDRSYRKSPCMTYPRALVIYIMRRAELFDFFLLDIPGDITNSKNPRVDLMKTKFEANL
uniref:Uncharacterized protein n=1 Tax=Timema cristinae TaxID=61476 RepID=A0A7R9CRV5_TIMCR|nr:unnamed protein product [Timema cristinae]